MRPTSTPSPFSSPSAHRDSAEVRRLPPRAPGCAAWCRRGPAHGRVPPGSRRTFGATVHGCADEAERRIGHLYPKVRVPNEQGGGQATVVAWLWARTVTCPEPGMWRVDAACPVVRLVCEKGARSMGRADHRSRRQDGALRTAKTGCAKPRPNDQSSRWHRIHKRQGKKSPGPRSDCVVCRSGVARGEYIDIEANAGRDGRSAYGSRC